jgi:hypothetical protein
MEENMCARFVSDALMIEQKQEWIASFQDVLFMADGEN